MSVLSLDRLTRLIGSTRARCHMAGECYIANVRSYANGHEELYRAQCQNALKRWVELCREVVNEWDANGQRK